MSLEAHVIVDDRGVDVALSVSEGSGLALFGPNGAGKTTILEVIAGIATSSSGAVSLGGQVLRNHTRGSRRAVPLRERRIALVAQDAALFTSMSVLDNVAFGLVSRGMRRAAARSRAREWLAHVDAVDLAARPASHVSGGQARRIAVARALATEPAAIMLDEPFAGLDAESATHLRHVLATACAATTRVIATHSALDAVRLASDAMVIHAGKVTALGSVTGLLARPTDRFVAALSGRVWIAGTWQSGALRIAESAIVCSGTQGCADGQPAALALDVNQVRVCRTTSDPRNASIPDFVAALEERDSGRVRIVGSHAWADVAAHDDLLAGLEHGSPITFELVGPLDAYAVAQERG